MNKRERGKGYSTYPEMTETGGETLPEGTINAFDYIYKDYGIQLI